MRLRQIALVGRDLDKASADIADVLGLGAAYADPGVGKYGLVNQVWPIGDTFLEVVSPAESGTTAERLLDKRGGDGGYMAIFQVDDIEAARARIAALGVRVVSQADRDGVFMTHLHPKDTGGAIISIDAMEPRERWEWGGPDWERNVRTETSLAIVGAELQADDPDVLSARWAEVLGLPREQGREGWKIKLDGGELRFVTARDGRGEGLGAFDVAVRDPAAVRARAEARGCLDADGEVLLCGTRVRLTR
jgi:catechol 2,3-dioxygenase-like lactoylglutathione lyase family enzyme